MFLYNLSTKTYTNVDNTGEKTQKLCITVKFYEKFYLSFLENTNIF